MNKFSKYIAQEETDIDDELFKKHFNFQRPSSMAKDLYKTNHGEKNNKLVSVINSGLKDLEKEIKEMSKRKREIEKPIEIVEIVKEILNFNKQNQQGQGLKILTPSQILTRLPISLAQLKAGNNSEQLKDEIRQLLYSLYRSKNMTKQVYNNLISTYKLIKNQKYYSRSLLIKFLCNCFIIIIIIIMIIITIIVIVIKWKRFL